MFVYLYAASLFFIKKNTQAYLLFNKYFISLIKRNIMKTPLVFRFIFLALCLLFQITIGYAQPKDNQELIKLYNAAGGQKWINSWDVEQPVSEWYGVKVDTNDRVIGLDLSSNNLIGALPYMNLPFLQELDLSDNRLSGLVPFMTGSVEFGVPLKRFDINENEFTFEDIAKNYEANNSSIGDFIYQRQYYGSSKVYQRAFGESVTLEAEYSGNLSNQATFQWRSSRLDSGDPDNPTDYPTGPTYAFDVDAQNVGRYYVIITEPEQEQPSDLRLYSYDRIIDLKANPNPDSEYPAVIPDEMIIDRSLLSPSQLDELNKLIANNPGVYIKDACNCNNDIVLLHAKDNINLLQKIIPDTKTESSKSGDRTDPDDGTDNNYRIFLPEEIQNRIWKLVYQDVLSPGTLTTPVKVGVLDTGYDLEPDRVLPRQSDPACTFVDFGDNDNDLTPTNPHGNHVSSLVYADIQSAIKFVPVKIFGDDGTGTLFDMICGVHYTLDEGVDIINISASYGGEKSILLENAIKRAYKESVVVVVSAGNGIDGKRACLDKKPFYPAAFEQSNVITVGSIRPRPIYQFFLNPLSGFSNYSNKHVDIVTYGECIRAAGLNGNKTNLSGTSQSTALVTRALAIHRAKGNTLPVNNPLAELSVDVINRLKSKVKGGKKLRRIDQKLNTPF